MRELQIHKESKKKKRKKYNKEQAVFKFQVTLQHQFRKWLQHFPNEDTSWVIKTQKMKCYCISFCSTKQAQKQSFLSLKIDIPPPTIFLYKNQVINKRLIRTKFVEDEQSHANLQKARKTRAGDQYHYRAPYPPTLRHFLSFDLAVNSHTEFGPDFLQLD